MNIRDEGIQTLMELGLTLLQAKTYLALCAFGNATIKTISKATSIAKQDVYRVMPKLQELGLVEKMVAAQATYRAVPVESATSALFQRKTQEYSNLQEKTAELISCFRNNNLNKPVQEEDSQFRVISEKKLLYRLLDERNRTVQKSLDVSGTWKGTKGALFRIELKDFERAMKKGVRMRWITETHEEDKQAEKILKTLTKYPLFEIRYFSPPPPLQTAIYDEKEVSMCIVLPPSNEVTSIWSNNPMLVKLIANYYEEIWKSAFKYKSEKTAEIPRQEVLSQLPEMQTTSLIPESPTSEEE